MKLLLDYLNSLPVTAQESFASRCETTVGYLRQIAYGHRACPAHLAINIERESNRALICEELRPTGVDWAYIRAERRRKGVRRLIADRRNPPSNDTPQL
jgi:DNA-binding transcriptional regulator YdaS (Cro superfamily)